VSIKVPTWAAFVERVEAEIEAQGATREIEIGWIDTGVYPDVERMHVTCNKGELIIM